MFLDLNRESWKSYSRSFDEYLEAFKAYTLVDYKMIVYIDSKHYDRVKDLLKDQPKKRVISITEQWLSENSWIWRRLPIETEIMAAPVFINIIKHRLHCPETYIPKYTLINHAKIDIVCHSIPLVDTDYLAWVDFGQFSSRHIHKIPNNIMDLSKLDLHKLNICSTNYITEKDQDIYYTLKEAPEVINGYFFFGVKQALLEYQQLFHKNLLHFEKLRIADDDQHLALRCIFEKPEMFKVWTFPDWFLALQYFQRS